MRSGPSSPARLAPLALLAALAAPLAAQDVLAHYPLLTDLADRSGNAGPALLTGFPTPPPPPADGVCLNGVYIGTNGGSDLSTPNLTALDVDDFQVQIEFTLASLPSNRRPILVGGGSYRWASVNVGSTGLLGVAHNNGAIAWSSTTVALDQWHTAVLKHEAGSFELYLDGVSIQQGTFAPLNTGGQLDFTSNNSGYGGNHHGCLRNVIVANDTTLGAPATAASYGASCDGLTFGADGLPVIGNNDFAWRMSNVPASSLVTLIAFGSSRVEPGLDLLPIGMGGCASYTAFDLGLFGPWAINNGESVYPLAIPNDVNLVGVPLAAQGVAFTQATTLGLASSNGVQVVFGY